MSLTDANENAALMTAGARLRSTPDFGQHRIEGLGVRMWTRAETLYASGGLALFVIAAASIWGLTGAVVPWDSKNQFYPMFRFLAEALQHHELPLWNPYQFGGNPTVADPQSLLFTPTLGLFALLDPNASMTAFDLVVFAHLAAGGFGVIGLARRRGWAPAAAVLAALIYLFGGSASARLQHTGMIISYGWFPLAFWSMETLLARNDWRRGILFGFCAGMMALGRDQVAYLFCLFLVANVLWHGVGAGRPIAYLRERWAPLLTAAIIGGGLLAIPALLTIQYLGNSNRPSIGYDTAITGSLHPLNFVTLLAPDFFGSIDRSYDYWGPGSWGMTGALADHTDRSMNYLFVGTLPVVLMLWHGLGGGRLFARGGRFFLGALVFAILYALGRFTPFFSFAYDHLPGVQLYRRPADATFLFNVGMAFLSGFLLNRYIFDGVPRPFQRLPRRIGHALPHIAGLTVVSLLIAGLHFAWLKGRLVSSAEAIALPSLWVGICIVVLARSQTLQRRALAAALLVAATGVQLIERNVGSFLNSESAKNYALLQNPDPEDKLALEFLEREIALQRAAGARPRVEVLGLSGTWQNASMIYGFENTLGYNPLRIADYERLVGPGENGFDKPSRSFPGTFRSYNGKLASLLGLQYLVLDEPLARMPRRFPRPSATQIYASAKRYIYRLGRIAPRAYIAHAIIPVEVQAVAKANAFPDFDSAREALVDSASLAAVSSTLAHVDHPPSSEFGAGSHATAADVPAEKVAILDYEDNEVTLSVDAQRAGIVVLHDLFYPGWQVFVDGEHKPLLRANLLFRGVETLPGKHVVKFVYRPFSIENIMAALHSLTVPAMSGTKRPEAVTNSSVIPPRG
jgi:hypothetical protein